MTRSTAICFAIAAGIAYGACNRHNASDSSAQQAEIITTKTTDQMKNLISIVEIPTADFPRAVTFYQKILSVSIEEVDMGGVRMGLFPGDGETVNVTLIKGDDYKPSTDGPLVYLNGGDDLQNVLDKIESAGGNIIVPKTAISPEIGYFAMFIDTEGNKLGLFSPQ